ncbi:MAG: Flp pilus assembly complex ATPase component TadA [Candidatus Aenigmarchaeota archaeon]|nr:Flp pilus assembly complex ATPase component TadA [Candidatus Aenigmarchaeota archaeon]
MRSEQTPMLKKIKSMRGVLYRKIMERRKPPEPAAEKSRAGTMLEIMRKGHERKQAKKSKKTRRVYPKFRVEEREKFILSSWNKSRPMIYPLIKPYAYTNIRWNPAENAVVYNLIEPNLTPKESEMLHKIKEGLVQVINVSLDKVKKSGEMMGFLEESVQSLLDDYGYELGDDQYLKIMYYVYRDYTGLNEIEPLLNDPYIEDISCDGVETPIFVVHQKLGSLKTNIVFEEDKKLKEFVVKLAERCDRYISYAEPLLDGSLPDGTRVQASLAGDVTTRGPTFSIRKFPEKPFTPVDMLKLGTASPEMLAYLWFVVENGANILIAGGTATGKTSFLNAISLFINPESKIVSIEDTRELNLPHENWVPGVSRIGFVGTKVGEVSMYDLLRESFRQNPDYLIVGEVRGREASVMFQGMASGHISISTMHAGDVDDVIKRLITRPISLTPSLIEVLDIVILMVHAREKGKSARRVKKIVEIESVSEKGEIRSHDIFNWNPVSDSFEYSGDSKVLKKMSEEKGISMEGIIKVIDERKDVLTWLVQQDHKDWKEVVRHMIEYINKPEKMMEKIRGS